MEWPEDSYRSQHYNVIVDNDFFLMNDVVMVKQLYSYACCYETAIKSFCYCVNSYTHLFPHQLLWTY